MDSKVAQAQLSKERLSMSRSSISKSKVMTKLGYLNWNEAGFVSPVSNQETCGACYAFATVIFIIISLVNIYSTLKFKLGICSGKCTCY